MGTWRHRDAHNVYTKGDSVMIPPIDAYTPTVDSAASSPSEGVTQQALLTGDGSTQAQAFIDPQVARGLPQQERAFSMRELNNLLKNLTKMIGELSKLWNRQGVPEPVYRILPYDPPTKQTLPPTIVTPPSQSAPWLTPIEFETPTIIPDIEDSSPPAETPATPTPPATTPDLGGMGVGTSGSEPPEVIPDLDPELPAPPSGGKKEYSIGTSLSRSGKFVWKPVSEKDGKLAIILPPRLTGKVKSVAILSSDKTKILAKGNFTGVANENREHFRFSKAGGRYPDNSFVMITMKDGKTYNVKINETSDRYER